MSGYKLIDATSNELPMVSVAMLAYNHEAYISQAIESVLMQSVNFTFQIVIAEDHSNDGTRQIVLDYQKRYPNLFKVLLQNQNVGMAQNNHSLLENLNGKYVAVLEGDDYWIDPLKLQTQVDFLEANETYSMVFSGCKIINTNQNINTGIETNLETRTYVALEIFRKWIVPTASVVFRNMYKEEIFKNCAHKDVIFPDIILFLTLASKGEIYCISTIMSAYRRHASGVSVINPLQGKKAVLHYKAVKEIFGSKFHKIGDNFIAKVYLNMALTNFRTSPLSSIINFVTGLYYDFNVVIDYVKLKLVKQ